MDLITIELFCVKSQIHTYNCRVKCGDFIRNSKLSLMHALPKVYWSPTSYYIVISLHSLSTIARKSMLDRHGLGQSPANVIINSVNGLVALIASCGCLADLV